MKLWLVSFANRRYALAQRCQIHSARRFGFDQICSFDEYHLQQTDFYRQHAKIFSAERGAGYWLWKPYYIAHTLQAAAPDDVIVYCDSAIEFIADIRPLVEICRESDHPVLFQTHNHLNVAWTKRDCFVGMDCDTSYFHSSQQVMGGLQFYRRCDASIEFVHTWLNHCRHSELLTDDANTCGLPNYPEFVAHRHDQSILSLLAAKWQLPVYRDPSQWGTTWMLPQFRQFGPSSMAYGQQQPYGNSPYGQIINHHRCRKGPKRTRMFLLSSAADRFRELLPLRKAG
jgi:hypothetical protein